MGLVYVILDHNYFGQLTVIMQKLSALHTSNTNAQYSMNYRLCIIVANKQFVVHSTMVHHQYKPGLPEINTKNNAFVI